MDPLFHIFLQALPHKYPDIWYIILMVAVFLILTDSTFLLKTVGTYKEFFLLCYLGGAAYFSFCGVLVAQILSASIILLCISLADWPYGCGGQAAEETAEEKCDAVEQNPQNTKIS